jgi:hypothetical protein
VKAIFQVKRTSDNVVELNKRLSNHKKNNQLLNLKIKPLPTVFKTVTNKPRRITSEQNVQNASWIGQSLAAIIARFALKIWFKNLNRKLVSDAHRTFSKLAICVTIANLNVSLATTPRWMIRKFVLSANRKSNVCQHQRSRRLTKSQIQATRRKPTLRRKLSALSVTKSGLTSNEHQIKNILQSALNAQSANNFQI